jgi:hypothetical protein
MNILIRQERKGDEMITNSNKELAGLSKKLRGECEQIRLDASGRYIKGGEGSHWEGCEETHSDCKIAKLEKENEQLRADNKALTDSVLALRGEMVLIKRMWIETIDENTKLRADCCQWKETALIYEKANGESCKEVLKLNTQLMDACKVIDLIELTDGQMPSDTRARLSVVEFRRKYPEVTK